MVTLTDEGGLASDYSPDTDYTTTICSVDNSTAQDIKFAQFATELTDDPLLVWDSDLATGTPDYTFSGLQIPDNFTVTSGCVTFNFATDAQTEYGGFAIEVTCNRTVTD